MTTKKKPRVFEGACRVCHGDLVEKIVHEFNPASGPAIIGPGSKGQFRDVSRGFYCKQCGLKYEFVPDQGKKEKE